MGFFSNNLMLTMNNIYMCMARRKKFNKIYTNPQILIGMQIIG